MAHNHKKFLGKKFGMLTVKRYIGYLNRKHWYLFQCDCGGETESAIGNVTHGNTKSCGCLCRKVHYSLPDEQRLSVKGNWRSLDEILEVKAWRRKLPMVSKRKFGVKRDYLKKG